MLSASANRLSRLKEQAEEYAALIMEELDPEGLGYIEVNLSPSLSYLSHTHKKKVLKLIKIHVVCDHVHVAPGSPHHGPGCCGVQLKNILIRQMLQTFQTFLIVGAQMDGQEDNSQVMKFNRQCQIRFGTI